MKVAFTKRSTKRKVIGTPSGFDEGDGALEEQSPAGVNNCSMRMLVLGGSEEASGGDDGVIDMLITESSSLCQPVHNPDQARADAQDRLDTSNVRRAFACKELGCEAAEQGDFANAMKHWQEGLFFEPDNYLLHELMAQGLLQAEQWVLAVKSAERAVAIAPTWADGHLTLARAQREMGELECAFSSYQRTSALLKIGGIAPGGYSVDAAAAIELVEEMNDTQRLMLELQRLRQEHLDHVHTSASEAEIEANKCIYHLTSRATSLAGVGLRSQRINMPDAGDDGGMMGISRGGKVDGVVGVDRADEVDDRYDGTGPIPSTGAFFGFGTLGTQYSLPSHAHTASSSSEAYVMGQGAHLMEIADDQEPAYKRSGSSADTANFPFSSSLSHQPTYTGTSSYQIYDDNDDQDDDDDDDDGANCGEYDSDGEAVSVAATCGSYLSVHHGVIDSYGLDKFLADDDEEDGNGSGDDDLDRSTHEAYLFDATRQVQDQEHYQRHQLLHSGDDMEAMDGVVGDQMPSLGSSPSMAIAGPALTHNDHCRLIGGSRDGMHHAISDDEGMIIEGQTSGRPTEDFYDDDGDDEDDDDDTDDNDVELARADEDDRMEMFGRSIKAKHGEQFRCRVDEDEDENDGTEHGADEDDEDEYAGL
jgi:hypothetical protein